MYKIMRHIYEGNVVRSENKIQQKMIKGKKERRTHRTVFPLKCFYNFHPSKNANI